jgi:hypothetical protein
MEKRFFEFLTHDERVDCLALGTIGKQPSGTKLLQAGDRPRALFVLLAGNAEVRRGDGVVLARLVSGDIFGEMSFIQSVRASADVVGDERRHGAHAHTGGHQRAFQGKARAGGRALSLARCGTGPAVARDLHALSRDAHSRRPDPSCPIDPRLCPVATTGRYLHARPTDSSARYLGV